MPNRRLAVFATHPIQYQVPIWRALAATSELDVVVHYFSDHCIQGELNAEFGVEITWDVPLLNGYEYRFLERNANENRNFRTKAFDAKKLLQKGRFDSVLIQGYTHRFERNIIVAAKALNIKTILRGELTDKVYNHGLIKTWIRNAYLWWFYKYIDAFCCIGKEAQQHLYKRHILDDRIFFSPYSVDSDLFQSQKKNLNRIDSRNSLGIGDNEVTFLYCGKLIQRKNPLLLAEAVGILKDKYNLSLIIIGDGPLCPNVEKKIRPLLGHKLHMPGFVNQSKLGLYYRAADVFVLPSNFETWGLVVNEAMQFGLPVIVSNKVGCHSDLVLEGQTGYLFQASNVNSLAEKMSILIEDRDSARKMSKNAKEHVRKYSMRASVRGILQSLGHE